MEMMHGNDWSGQDVTGWLASEKFNGWRARWTGGKLVSRNGNEFAAPDWFTAGLPDFDLDCELCLGRGFDHNDTHRAIAAGQWDKLRLAVFDVPGMVAERAVETIRTLPLPASAMRAHFWPVESTAAARKVMLQIVGDDGEGIMLRRPGSEYVGWRTSDLLKMKP